jgi:ubiquinone/menaquinone biosynthesis C-methylase UbiE
MPHTGRVTNTPDIPIASERVQEIYSRIAPFYDDVTRLPEHRAKERALELLDRESGEALLDVGIGTGVGLAEIVSRSGPARVVGLDFSIGMIDVARQLFTRSRLSLPLLVLADARRLPFAAASFDCLFSSYVLNVLPLAGIEEALAEFRRVLKPSGRLALANLTDGEGADAAFTDEWKERFLRDPEAMSATRPLRCLEAVRKAGFDVLLREYVSGEGSWPSEVLIATPQAPGPKA